ncbi:hypothetical protein NEF87_000537 [Candidatus Lokiarchaeum ossiferum]|uniref:Zinc ribbon domain-containing protein n=1 Tax=Candidatus Lokiarchaeum ossiferum TaxID=2951803 RepID=A0ABY6HL76_9ARCH|nr:hypothetical protein NEF87_000537 [Candidatus Lokiarchaeum sp. B-35]
MTYIPIIAPILTGQSNHRGSKARTAGIMMIFIMGIIAFLGFYLFRMNSTGRTFSISFEPVIMILLFVIMGVVIVTTMIYKAEMNSKNSVNTQRPMDTHEIRLSSHPTFQQKSNVILNCPACQNSLDEMALEGLLENKVVYCQFCGEKIHR